MARARSIYNLEEDSYTGVDLLIKKGRSPKYDNPIDLRDIDKIVRSYIHSQKDKKTAVYNIATIMNNIIDSLKQ